MLCRTALALLLSAQATAAPPSVVYLTEQSACPDTATLTKALRERLSRFDVSIAPAIGALPVAVVDLGDRYRVIIDGVVRDFADPSRDCDERAAEATVFIALTLEPPSLPPTSLPPPPLPPEPSPPLVLVKPAQPTRARPHRLEIQALIGTSLGLASPWATTDNGHLAISSGVMSEPLHWSIAVSARLSQAVSLGLQVRMGHPLFANAGSSPSVADFSLLLRNRFAFGTGKAHPFVSAGLGWGWIHHVVDVTSATIPPVGGQQALCPSTGSCYDTTTMSQLLISGSAGLLVDLLPKGKRGLAVIMETELEMPLWSQFGANFDFHIGLESQFF
jgi:hypothetical protein